VITGGSLPIKTEKAVSLALICENTGSLLMQLRDFKDWIYSPGTWCFFGGKIEPAEFPEAAITRELQEELLGQ